METCGAKKADRWTRRPRFRELAKAWIEANHPGIPKMKANEFLAQALGMSGPNVLRQYVSGNKMPGRDMLTVMHKVFNVPISDLWDDTNASPSPEKSQEWKNTSEKARFVASSIFNGVIGEDLSDAEVDVLYSAYQNALQTVKMLMDNKDKH